MTRAEYNKNRRLVKDNGWFALRWMTGRVLAEFEALREIGKYKDPLAERADIVGYCRRIGIPCNVRHTR